MKRRWTNRRHARCDRFRSAGRQPREFVPGGRSERYEVELSWRPRDSRSPVAAVANLAFNYIDEGVKAFVGGARGFAESPDILAQSRNIAAHRTNLMADSIDFAFMDFGDC